MAQEAAVARPAIQPAEAGNPTGASQGAEADTGPSAGAGNGTGPPPSSGSGGGGSGGGAGGGIGLRAQCLYCPQPTYPRIARLRGWEGTADVEVVLKPDGNVQQARIRKSSGHRVLDDAALAVARKSRFALPDGASAVSQGLIAYGFRLRN